MSEFAIACEKLCKTYREGWFWPTRRQALKEVTFSVRRGEIFGLLGGNGAGKTTFIKILLGIIRKSAGAASLLGLSAGDRRSRARVGYLPENLRVPRHMSGLNALRYYGQLSNLSPSEIRRKQDEVLQMVGLADRIREPVRNYSKGMLQRLGLAQAMLHDPDLFILDEPTDGLDPLARAQVRGYLSDLRKRGKTIFLNSHILQEVELICDRVAILAQGELRAVDDVAVIKQDAGKQRATSAVHVTLTVAGRLEALQQTLAAVPAAQLLPSTRNDSPHTVEFAAGSQAEVDALIDLLRAAGQSIVAILPRQTSLEDAYLAIVAQAVE